MNTHLLKWRETIVINMSKYMSYRLDFFLLTIAPSLVFFFIKYNLWTSIYTFTKLDLIKGYSLQNMLQYHALILVISMVTRSHSALDMAVEIRRGRISSYLIYPFNYYSFQSAQFLSFEIIQVIISILTLIILMMSGIISSLTFTSIFLTYIYCIFVSYFWFNIQFFTGILSFWLEETWVLRVLFSMITLFLSGAILPLELFPQYFSKLLMLTPFPYLAHTPVSYLMGKNVDLITAFTTISSWTIIMMGINRFTWLRGLKKYSGAGM